MKRLTPWYPAKVKPVRNGYYEASADDNSGCFYFWENGKWYFTDGGVVCSQQKKRWRGLASRSISQSQTKEGK